MCLYLVNIIIVLKSYFYFIKYINMTYEYVTKSISLIYNSLEIIIYI